MLIKIKEMQYNGTECKL